MSKLLYDAPGPNARARARVMTGISALFVIVVGVWALYRLGSAGMLASELWETVLDPELLTMLAHGLLATFEAAIFAIALSLILGAILAAGMINKSKSVNIILRTWIEVFRGLPLLLLIFFLFLGGPAFGLDVSTFWALVLGITLYNGAVFAEVFRAGINALPKGQGEAGLAIGLTRGEVFRKILLPQSVIRMLPAILSQLVTIVKETSLGFVIGYSELLRDARSAVEFLGGEYSLPVYTLIAIVYIFISFFISALARRAQFAL